jgi:predicted nucleotidyltransferase
MNLRYGSGSEATEDNRRRFSEQRLGDHKIPSYDEITANYPAFENAVTVFVAGSVVQGWSHANSDLDLYIVTNERTTAGDLETFERRVSTSDPVIRIALGEFGAYRADIELWRAIQIDEIIGRFAGSTPSQEAPELDKTEQDLLFRLASGTPLHGDEWWRERREALSKSCYGSWMAENRKLIAETFLEDTAGLLISGDYHTAVLTAREAIVLSLEAVFAIHGDYSVSRKWLYRRLQALPLAEITIEQAWEGIAMIGATDDLGGWAKKTAHTAQALLRAVEEAAA